MSDFSLTSVFVVPVGQSVFPSSGSTQDLTAGQLGVFSNAYAATNTPGDFPYFYVAQGRENTYLQGSKRSDKIASKNILEWYVVTGCPTAAVQITEVSGWNVKCGEVVTLTLRAHSSYIDTLYFNGFTRSVTVQAPCCDCGGDPCDTTDVPALIDQFITKLEQHAPGNNPDNISFSTFYTFKRVGNDENAVLRISGKPLTKYGQPCDVAAFPYEYDRMWFNTFVYSGPATTADFIVADNCNIVATAEVTQRSSYPTGTSDEIKQLEKNFYSYQAGYLKHLYRMAGYNENFESYVEDGTTYDTYYIKFTEFDKGQYKWGDYIIEDETVVIAVPRAASATLAAILEDALGTVVDDANCITTTTTTSSSTSTTTTTTTLIP